MMKQMFGTLVTGMFNRAMHEHNGSPIVAVAEDRIDIIEQEASFVEYSLRIALGLGKMGPDESTLDERARLIESLDHNGKVAFIQRGTRYYSVGLEDPFDVDHARFIGNSIRFLLRTRPTNYKDRLEHLMDSLPSEPEVQDPEVYANKVGVGGKECE